MNVAVVTLSLEGARVAERLTTRLPDCDTYIHASVDVPVTGERFQSIVELTKEIFVRYSGIVYVTPTGVAVRAVAPLLEHKTKDPAVVVVDVRARWAVSLVSGHERGANDLAMTVGNILSAEPIVTTTTEALKTLIVGIGCRRGTGSEQIVAAITDAISDAGLSFSDVRLLSSADIKADEEGLLKAARELDVPLRFISSQELRGCALDFQHSHFVEERVDLPAVAEPCALLAGRRTRLIVRRKKYNGVTVAIARESSLLSE